MAAGCRQFGVQHQQLAHGCILGKRLEIPYRITVSYLLTISIAQLYRCYIIWTESYYILILPGIVYLGSVGCAIALLVFAANPGAMYSSHTVQVFGTASWTLSLSLNVIVTVLIAGRLLYYRSRLREILGPNHGKVYTTIIAITVESAAIYAVFELMALVAFLTNSPTKNVFFPMLGNVQVRYSPTIYCCVTDAVFQGHRAKSYYLSNCERDLLHD